MKTNYSDKWHVTGDKQDHLAQMAFSCHSSPVTRHVSKGGARRSARAASVVRLSLAEGGARAAARPRSHCHASRITHHAFTLIELLVVIAIMAIIAGFTLVVVGAIKKTENIGITTAEMTQIGTALDNYKSKYGVYPPSNANLSPLVNTLYYELSGVYPTNNPNKTLIYMTLDSANQISTNGYQAAFTAGIPATSIGGVVNSTRGTAEEGSVAQDFLPDLKPRQIGVYTNHTQVINILITAAHSDINYMPLAALNPAEDTNNICNPFRYMYPGSNNPTSYDLWVQLAISGKTYLICNWSKKPIINSPLP